MNPEPRSSALIEFGPFKFDKALGALSKRGTPIRLRGMPLKLLEYLMERPGEAISRTELQALLWDGAEFGDFDQGLNTAVNAVRRALSDSAGQPRYIETVPGRGYRFIAALRLPAAVGEMDLSGTAPVSDSTVTAPNQSVETAQGSCDPPAPRKAVWPRWTIAAILLLATLGGVTWLTLRPRAKALTDGVRPSTIREANDQYELAMNFLVFQNDIPLARKTLERALQLDPEFASARLQHALMIVIEIFNGYTNDETLLYRAEEEFHQAERALPGSDGLLLSTQAAVYLAQGRLDRIPLTKLEEHRRNGGNSTWLAILRMLEGRNQEALAILRPQNESDPMNNPSRMFLGELLRTEGNNAGAIQALQRALQQAPGNITAAWFLTMTYLDEGQTQHARLLLQGMQPAFENNYMWRHAWAILLAAEGKRNDAIQAMDEATLKFARLTWAVTSTTAAFYALVGDHSKAIEWLQLAIARGDERVSYFRRNPRFATLRNDTRFESLLSSLEARGK